MRRGVGRVQARQRCAFESVRSAQQPRRLASGERDEEIYAVLAGNASDLNIDLCCALRVRLLLPRQILSSTKDEAFARKSPDHMTLNLIVAGRSARFGGNVCRSAEHRQGKRSGKLAGTEYSVLRTPTQYGTYVLRTPCLE